MTYFYSLGFIFLAFIFFFQSLMPSCCMHRLSCSLFFLFSLFAPCFSFSYTFLALLHHVLVSFSSLSFSVSKDFFPPLFFIYMRSLSLFLCIFLPPPHPISPLLALSLLEHCDTVVMVTPIIFWHEWRILYWWDGKAEGEKRRVMERKTKTDGIRERKTTGRENQNDMEMIVPAAYDTKHFHPVIFSVLMSWRGCCEAKHTESSRGVWDIRGCWRMSPKTLLFITLSGRQRKGDSSY